MLMTIRLLINIGHLGNMRYRCIFGIKIVLKFQHLCNKRTDIVFWYTCSSKDKTDMDVIKENHKFLWDDEEADTWWVREQYPHCLLEITQKSFAFFFFALQCPELPDWVN